MAGIIEKLKGVETAKEGEEGKDATKREMTKVSQAIENLKSRLDEKRAEIDATERTLQDQIEQKQKEKEQLEEALRDQAWQEKLESVDKALVALYREQRKKEDEINRAINKVFNLAAKVVEKINLMFKDIEELKKKTAVIERRLIQPAEDGDRDTEMRDAMEFRRAEVAREVEVIEEVKGGLSLVREVNAALGEGEPEHELLRRIAERLPLYAQNIYDEVRRSGGRPVRVREDELIRVARIPEPRIIQARTELRKNLDVLLRKELVTWEEEGDTLVLRENAVEE